MPLRPLLRFKPSLCLTCLFLIRFWPFSVLSGLPLHNLCLTKRCRNTLSRFASAGFQFGATLLEIGRWVGAPCSRQRGMSQNLTSICGAVHKSVAAAMSCVALRCPYVFAKPCTARAVLGLGFRVFLGQHWGSVCFQLLYCICPLQTRGRGKHATTNMPDGSKSFFTCCRKYIAH